MTTPTPAAQKAAEEICENLYPGFASAFQQVGQEIAAIIDRHVGAWLPITDEQRDGTWYDVWREPGLIGVRPQRVTAKWSNEDSAWIWPDQTYDLITPEQKERADYLCVAGNFYACDEFTHYMPLPPCPANS